VLGVIYPSSIISFIILFPTGQNDIKEKLQRYGTKRIGRNNGESQNTTNRCRCSLLEGKEKKKYKRITCKYSINTFIELNI